MIRIGRRGAASDHPASAARLDSGSDERIAGEPAPGFEVGADRRFVAGKRQQVSGAAAPKRGNQVNQQAISEGPATRVEFDINFPAHSGIIILTGMGGLAQQRQEAGAAYSDAQIGLAVVRLTIGAMFVWVFFENLGKRLYTAGGYAGLINYYINKGHAPAAWKAVMAAAASHASMAAPAQAVLEISLGVLLVLGLFARPAALVACLYLASLWVSEWGTAWIWELLVPVLASLGLAVGNAGRAWGLDALLARRNPSSRWW